MQPGRSSRRSNEWIWTRQYLAKVSVTTNKIVYQEIIIRLTIVVSEFHVTDDTSIGDPFCFVKPYLECRGMHLTKSSYSFIPLWVMVALFFSLKRLLMKLDFLALFTNKRDPLKEAMERDKTDTRARDDPVKFRGPQTNKKRWYHYVMPQTLVFMCGTSFLNRTKASLRLGYEPLFDEEESRGLSIKWYKNHLVLK